jgi:eukaryotic-like serine/threonine-protein kinase
MPTHWESCAEPIPGYRLQERLGRGGFGEVWKAQAPGGLAKAIKFVHGEITGGSGHHAQQELKALERVRAIRHPFILSMERYDIVDGQLLIVMELADCNIEQRLHEHQRQGLPGIPRVELLSYMTEAAEALDVMSREYDLQHLDIKPQNIFLIGGHVKVADFGLVKDLEGCTASVTGGVTPVYAPPETFDGWVSRNTDQYSLAIVYQELLTGQRPFPGPSARQFMMQHLTAEPDVSSLPPCDRPLVRRALSKDPKDRFGTCREFVESLREAGKHSYSTTSLLESSSTVKAVATEEGISTRLARRAPQAPQPDFQTTVRPQATIDRAAIKASTQGNLRPTLVIGLGRTGWDVLERVRSKLDRQYGDASAWPVMRLLGIDVESAITRVEEDGNSREALDRLLACKFRKPTQYFQNWESMKHLTGWLDPNTLFQISSSGSTNGHRALGRLAFFENHRRILARLRSEMETLLEPARLHSQLAACGELLRTEEPRVVVVASMSGGVGSGMFIDLCYMVRRVLLESGASRPDVDGYLMASTRSAKGPSDARRANTFALAQNILDFTQPEATFSVDYDGAGNADQFTGPPCQAIYYFDGDAPSLPEPRVEAVRDLVAETVIGSATKGVGKEIDRQDRKDDWPRHRSVGMFSLRYPIRDLLSRTSALLAAEMLEHWLSPFGRREAEQVVDEAASIMASAGFDPNAVAEALLVATQPKLDEPIHVATAKLLAEVEERFYAAPVKDHNELMRDAIDRIKELLGLDPDEDHGAFDQVPAFEQALSSATNDLANELLEPMLEALSMTLDRPGQRLERARKTWEGFSRYLLEKLDQTQELVRTEVQKVCRRARQMRDRLGLTSGLGAGIKEGVPRRIEILQEYAHEKIAGRVREQVYQVYLVLRAKLSDWSRECVRVRQTVDRLREQLLQEAESVVHRSEGFANQSVFPGGWLDLTQASGQLVEQVREVAFQDLDPWVQSTTLASVGGLWGACSKDEEFERRLPSMIMGAVGRWLQEGLSETDVASAFFDRHDGNAQSALEEVRTFLDWAQPTALYRPPSASPDPAPALEKLFVSVPNSTAGQSFAGAIANVARGMPAQTIVDGDECLLARIQAHESLARVLPKWAIDAKGLFLSACHSRLSPEIFPPSSTPTPQ